MSIEVCDPRCGFFHCASALVALAALATPAAAQVQLPEVVVSAPKEKPKPRPKAARAAPAATPTATPISAAQAKSNAFDQSRRNLYTPMATSAAIITQSAIQALPVGDNQPAEKILLQAAGVSQDSAASGLLRV